MTVREALQKRRSIRKFTDEPVSREDIDLLLHAAFSGPSACNRTPWDFYVITNGETLEKLRGASHYSHVEAPLAIVVCGSLTRALPQQLAPYWVQDCSAASENILLQATELGLGSVWCGIHPQKRAETLVSRALGLKENCVPLNILYIGHPAEEQPERDQYYGEYVHFVE